MEDFKTNFRTDYLSPPHPIAFAGITQIYNFYNKEVPIKDIKAALQKIETYTLHKHTKKQIKNPFFIYFKRQQFQIDLVDFSDVKEDNKNIAHLLTCIDVFTRKAFVRGCVNKKGPTILSQFKSILEEAGSFPRTVVSDKGSEIKNKLFLTFCKQNNIKTYFPENKIAPHIERFNQTLQNLIYKLRTKTQSLNYIDRLPDLVSSYNNRIHRIITMTPNDAEKPENQSKVFLITFERIYQMSKKYKNQKPRFKVNDVVRLQKKKALFHRSYDEKFTEELFIITNVNTNLIIPTYNLKDLMDEPILGSFYGFELTKATKPEIYKIEKVLKQRTRKGKKEELVRYKGYPAKFDQWIPVTNYATT